MERVLPTRTIPTTPHASSQSNEDFLVSTSVAPRPPMPSTSVPALPSRQPSSPRPRARRKMRRLPLVHGTFMLTLLFLLSSVNAAFIVFDNCLDPAIINSNPKQLQFTPYFFSARFNTTSSDHNLNITIYGNVSGQATEGTLPSVDNTSYWNNPNDTFGKIVDLSESNNKLTTLFAKSQVLSYTPFDDASRFCEATVNTSCPIGPSFYKNRSNPYDLSAFTVAHNFYSTYAFSTLATTIRVQSGDAGAPDLACVSANITPDLGSTIANALCFIPAAILIFVAAATVFAAMYSPWGSSDPFRWTSNYGRDEDLLRLVTPGFGDCLAYIQFIVLAGSLNLAYPGFYQPVVSQASWSSLLFNESFVSDGTGSYRSLVDGLYVVNGTYGLSRLGEIVGMRMDRDIWATMAVWYLGLTAAAVLLCQGWFLLRWLKRFLTNTQEEDLRSKNAPFSTGIIVRMTFNYFLLPIVALSFFQLVVATTSPASVVAMAVVLLFAVIGFAAWIFRLIFTTKPRAYLFDDLPTVLMYGPLYNTYSDDAAPFAFIPVLLSFVRGVAIGAIQPSGIAQLIILAICEVIYILTLHAFRPFQAPTSMNAYHTFFSIIRLVTTLLMVAFVPNLGVSESSKGWLGYVILLLHAIVLIFGFLLNAVQTIIEVGARLAGAGDARGGLTKVFGKRQLSRRHRKQRSSLNSNAAMLAGEEGKSVIVGSRASRSRSLSASSTVLLSRAGVDGRISGVFDRFSQGGEVSLGKASPELGASGGMATPHSFLPSGSASTATGSRRVTLAGAPMVLGSSDPYYRPPRPRKEQNPAAYTPGARSRASWGSGDWSNRLQENGESVDIGEGPSLAQTGGSLTPAYLRNLRDDSDPNINETRRPRTDYAVRESDFYYGVTRGPPLAEGVPTRKLKTGPADPMGPVASAGSWFKGLFGGKRKDKGKGFEVVRSTRAPHMMALEEDDETGHEPYRDNPDTTAGANRNSTSSSSSSSINSSRSGARGRDSAERENLIGNESDPFDLDDPRASAFAPTLGPIETAGGIELPTRMTSKASSNMSVHTAPEIPRKSSKRQSSYGENQLSEIAQGQVTDYLRPSTAERVPSLPFGSSEPSPSPERSAASSIGGREAYSEASEGGSTARQGALSGEGERPLSTGYVHQHKASDSIQPGMYNAGTHLESQAEFVQDSTTRR
ncbi:hypothetical protein IWZ01DRAFT_494882 [Phyllosticta capitalensis]